MMIGSSQRGWKAYRLQFGLVLAAVVLFASNLRMARDAATQLNDPELTDILKTFVDGFENFTVSTNETAEEPSHETEDEPLESDFDIEPFPGEPVPRPPLDSIVQEWNITGDASWLLNVAIVGFPKCGTSTLMYHLESHPEVHIFAKERCDLTGNQQVTLIRDLYNDFPPGNFVRGIKCPQDIESTGMSMKAYGKWFPKTRIIVGIRHPVLWMESFYNFRTHNKVKMPPLESLIGRCGKGQHGVCTMRSYFHLFLSNLGKTPLTDPDEIDLIPKRFQKYMVDLNFSAPVFLYEVSQLSDHDEQRNNALRRDLQRFLGLKEPIPPFIWFKPGMKHSDTVLSRIEKKKVNICDDRYDTIRAELMESAVGASRWISRYFANAPGVYISSREHLSNVILKGWERDPCLDRLTNSSIATNASFDGDLGPA